MQVCDVAGVACGGAKGVGRMANVKVQGRQSHRPRLRPANVITALLVLVLVVVAVTQRELIGQVIEAMSSGALLAIAAAAVLESTRIGFHAYAYTRAFKVIGATVPLRATVPAYLKMIFMNTVIPSGGTSGMAAVVDTARSRGVPVGSATSATVFVQTCYYSAMFLVIVVGFVVMGASGTLTVRDVLLGSSIGVAAAAFLALLALGHLKPGLLQRIMRRIEALVVRACALVHLRHAPKPWADNLVHSFSSAATELSRRPRQALSVFASMAVAMGFDMLAFVASGLAFGIMSLPALLGGYVTALVFNSFNCTPGGVGIVEGLAAAVLAGYGYPGTLAVSAVLTYRALMYWIPFAVGGVMMRLTGAFTGKGGAASAEKAEGPASEGGRARVRLSLRERLYDMLASRADRRATLCALGVAAVSVLEIVATTLPRDAAMLATLAQYVHLDAPLSPLVVISVAYLLLLCVPGLFVRDQGCWLLTVTGLACLGAAATLSGNVLATAVAPLVAMALLVMWHSSFTLHVFLRSVWRLTMVLLYGIVVAVVYAVTGFVLLAGDVSPQPDALGAAWLGLQTLVSFPKGVELDARALWLAGSVRAMSVTLLVALVFVLAQRLAVRVVAWRRPDAAAMRAFNRAEAKRAQERRHADREERRRERAEERRARRRAGREGDAPAGREEHAGGEGLAGREGEVHAGGAGYVSDEGPTRGERPADDEKGEAVR